jgi:phosphoribosyl 1,2-cyclic phosphodiesterase
MSLFTASLNSGSNGNCYYVSNGQEAVLVDAGISCRETEKRMARLGLTMESVKAVFISHEHTDHIRGLEVLSRKHKLPVYITEPTLKNGRLNIEPDLLRSFHEHIPIVIGGLTITGFPKEHDAADPYSFLVQGNGVTIGVITDVGIACKRVIHYFKQCHAVYLETNYDITLLEEGHYPIYLKHRIRGGKGHLSNDQALELFKTHKPKFMSHVFLSHLSKDNNRPQLAADAFIPHAGNTHIVVASRYKETAVYRITAGLSSIHEEQAMVLPGVQATLF